MKWVLLFVAGFLLFIAFNIQAGWLFVLDFLLMAFLLSSWLLPRLWIAGSMSVERYAKPVFEGEETEVLLRIGNFSSLDKFFLLVEDVFPALENNRTVSLFLPKLPKKKIVELTYKAKAQKRGIYSFQPIFLKSIGPAAFFESKRKIACKGELIVYPSLESFPLFMQEGAPSPFSSEKGLSFGKGDGEDFYGIREYAAGDSLRTIHWPSSAKAGKLMIRDMMRTHPMLYALYLDRHKKLNGVAFEKCVKLAAYAASEILRQGHWLSWFQNGVFEPKDWHGSLNYLAGVQADDTRSFFQQMQFYLPVLASQKQLIVFTVAPTSFSEKLWEFAVELVGNSVNVFFVFVGSQNVQLEHWLKKQGLPSVFVEVEKG
jgi:uncharacterized protein (DUF58 family)